jgi:hypothetical protein
MGPCPKGPYPGPHVAVHHFHIRHSCHGINQITAFNVVPLCCHVQFFFCVHENPQALSETKLDRACVSVPNSDVVNPLPLSCVLCSQRARDQPFVEVA